MDKDFRKLIQELNVLKGQLKEVYFQENPIPGEEEQISPEQQQTNPEMMGQGNSEEELEMHAHEIIQHEPIIGKIRETAIEGLKKYSGHPTSDLYNFFKKVFLESDKVLTDTGKK